MLATSPRWLLAVLALGLLLPVCPAAQPDRQQRTTPGLVLDTGARHAACDVLQFTRDGATLLAAGDDKVVREWAVGADHFTSHRSKNLRWPAFREQKGSIFALDLSPDPEQSKVAIGGFGMKVGMVAILDRKSGQLLHALSNVTSDDVVWKIKFTPSGKQVVYGSDDGGIYLWDFAAGKKESVLLKGSGGSKVNRVRLVSFLDASRFITVAQDGKVQERSLASPHAVKTVAQFRLPSVFRVSVSPDRKWLAATGENAQGAKEGKQANTRHVEVMSLAGSDRRYLKIPAAANGFHMPRSLAFDAASQRLAVGVTTFPNQSGNVFFKEIGGHVFIYKVASGERTAADLDLGYRAEKVAFRPGKSDQVATAGGDNHEVRLWDIDGKGKELDTIKGPGTCLWGVGLSADRRFLGFRDHRNPNPPSPLEWGTGPWRVLDLKSSPPRILPHAPAGFSPVPSDREEGGWKVRFTNSAYLWEVVGPGGKAFPLDAEHGLYDPTTNNLPRCYTFLKARAGKPVRLVVGHTWGLTVYACKPSGVQVDRVLVGHEGEVMAVAPSADGKLLLSASRDETIAGWSLEDWPSQPEFGASFVKSGGKLVVRKVDAGSPAWELGLTEGDEIQMLVVTDEKLVYNTTGKDLKSLGIILPGAKPGTLDQALARLAAPRPGREMIFFWKTPKGEFRGEKTTVRQRPLWRFFPTRNNEYVIWRWRDFYYDTNSVRADNYLGWHVNQGLDATPAFHRLEHFRRRFHNPHKVWKTVRGGLYQPDKVIFAEIEPPRVEVQPSGTNLNDQDLVLKLNIRPQGNRPELKVERVTLWLDDYRYPDLPKPDRSGAVVGEVRIPKALLRKGANRITVQGFNVAGGRGERTLTVTYDTKQAEVKPTLYALCVGVNDYSKVKGLTLGNLSCPQGDAEAVARMLRQQAEGALYRKAEVTLLKPAEVSRARVLGYLEQMQKQKLHRNDWLVVFLSGHGVAPRDEDGLPQADSFYYACPNTDVKRQDTKLTGKELAEALSRLPCHKLVLLDACRSGAVASNPLRALAPDGVPPLIFSACRTDQEALEPKKPDSELGRHGLFTRSLLEGVEKAGSKVIDARQLARDITTRLNQLVEKVNDLERRGTKRDSPKREQTPVFYPDPVPRLPVFSPLGAAEHKGAKGGASR